MAKKVKLSSLVDGLEVPFDGVSSYLNLATGEVLSLSDRVFVAAEDEEPIDEFEGWEQTEYEFAVEILNHPEQYLELPDEDEINEYRMMESFCYHHKDKKVKQQLSNAIIGRGAFRRFKDQAISLGVIEDWYSFKRECYKDIMIEWCEMNGLEYE
ncbi:UPF0158 family protein [Rossellomorea oryzaecorticis]|jgi:Uncharacterised protein family (UPF0158)|uniref:UPF0158 family protein n=1 Tax=Rossellomorea oryzaecorticis TaxID=1396505 RepID=A0ABW8VI85_9BACI|nr:UPF0158 family protein [[Bacillus] enclensis]MBH9966017.1 hypothetical protein [[Bacillus] enclensis]QTC41406.1 hypothetical protein I7V34_20515 [Bacillus sp. V3]